VKVLDFGLAKATESGGTSFEATNSPTITSPAMLTGIGVILGTAAYLSPEQAKRRPADKRGDIWAFGCVLYEMLTGKWALEGQDVSDTFANVLKTQPDWRALPETTPQPIRRLLQRSLAKEPKLCLPDIADARLEIDEALTTPSSEAAVLTAARIPGSRSRWGRALSWAVAGALGLALLTVLVLRVPRSGGASPSGPMTRLDLILPTGVELSGVIHKLLWSRRKERTWPLSACAAGSASSKCVVSINSRQFRSKGPKRRLAVSSHLTVELWASSPSIER
jgi:serine/threonine protein kinase